MGPEFLELAGHRLRWRLLTELAGGDRQVRELTGVLAEKQSLVSYHLGRLRAGGLVSMRRSSADGRDVYYSLDLVGCGQKLAAAGAALHPGLRMTPVGSLSPSRPSRRRVRVLFLCTGNSARSQMARALLEQLAPGRVTVLSAGSQPKALHPNAVRVMRERGVDISDRQPTSLTRYLHRRFDYVVSLCDRVREVCPEFDSHPRMIHWSIADPAAGGGTADDSYPAFERTAEDLAVRVRFFLHLLDSR